MAFDAGDMIKARTYAEQFLSAAAASKGGWNTGNLTHKGNLVLGRIAR
jgi:hypothetical protein